MSADASPHVDTLAAHPACAPKGPAGAPRGADPPRPRRREQAFPERRLAGGRRVGTLAELVEYLAAADPAIRVAELPLEGRNRVVYCTAWS